jgi:hypothetical protein
MFWFKFWDFLRAAHASLYRRVAALTAHHKEKRVIKRLEK